MNEGWLCDSILKTTASPSPISITPAFSPGPQMTRGPVVGSVFSQIFDDLYEQCSLHIAAKMPVSVRLGVRPRIAEARANSSALNPISAANSAVTLELIIGARMSRVLQDGPRRSSLQRADKAVEKGPAVGAAEERIGGVLGVRHQPQNRAGVVEDAGDGAGRAVEVIVVGQRARRAAIAEGDAALALQPVERILV